ncbi:MAG: Adventurous gliding motility protein K, partial [Myxococcaceae bacterium]
MSERNDLPRTTSFATIPAVQPTNAAQTLGNQLQQFPAGVDEDARAQIAVLDREAKALGNDPSAAMLFHQIGLLWEDPLKNPPNAAVAYQKAYKLAPRFLANIRAARRLFADVGNSQMVVQLLEAELAAAEDARTKAALTFEKAQVLEEKLSRDEEALKSYKAVLQMLPEDAGLLTQLEAVFAARQDHASLVETYLLLAGAVKDESVKAHYLTAAGLLLEDRLQRADEAAQCFRQAFAIERKDPLLLNAMKRLAERQGRTDELLSALAAEAELLGAQAGPTYLRIAKVYEKLSRREDALAALLAARRASPTEALVLSELADIYETQGRHEDLADILLTWVSAIQDESEVVAINLRLAELYEGSLKRDTDAIARYQAILQRVPGHTTALAGLGKLYFRTQNWEGLFNIFEAESNGTEDPKQKAAKVFKAAELLEEKLGRLEDSIHRYNQCLQIQPGYLPAQKALVRIFEKQDRYAELVAMYEADLLQTADREQIVDTLNKMAVIYEERLSDLDHAIDCMKRILDHSPDHLPTLRNMARLYERAGKWQELISLHESEATLVGDTKQVLSLFHRNAEILEENLKDRQNAIVAYERLLSLSPSYLPALKALGRLYAQDSRWDELIRMYRAEAEIASTTEHAASLIYKIGELYQHRLKNENEAIANYQEVLTLAPSFFPALRALARIYRAQQAWESLIEVLRAEAANRTDPVERANALFQAASIWEDQLNREDMAIEGYQEVLRLTPGHAASIRALERLYSTRNDAKELIAVLDRETQTAQSGPAKVAAYLKLARIYLEKLNEPIRAANACEAILQIDGSNLFALKTLERIRVSDKARRSELRARLSERVSDPRLKTTLAVSAANDRDSNSPPAAELAKALQEDPQDLRVAFALERALRQSQDYTGLAALFEKRAAAISDTQERVELALRIGYIYESKLNDAHKALAAYKSALDFDGKLIPALQGVRRMAARIGDWKSARAAAEGEAQSSRDIKGAVDAFNAAAKLALTQLNDADGAVALYKRALERDALDPIATSGMEDILASRGGSSDLAGLQERRGEAKLQNRDFAAAAQDFFSAAKTYATRVKDPIAAMAAVSKALSAHPTHP